MNVQILKRIGQSIALLLFLVTFAGNAVAEDVAEGTVLSKDNLAALESQRFQGIKVGDLLTDTQKMWINTYGLKMKLGKTTELKFDPAYMAATKKNAGQAKFDSASKTVSNYQAGIPFPKVDMNDPDAGYKLAWNQYYANPITGDNWIAVGDVTIVDGDKGVINSFQAVTAKTIMEGRTTGGPAQVGEEADHARYLLVLSKPYDLAGLGIYTKQYNTGKVDDAWAYVKSIRRTRRVAGGKSWMDPQPKMDLLNDDNQAINAYPLFYQGWKLLGKRWILAVVNGFEGAEQGFENLIEQQPPYWNTTNVTWEPREVYVVEATPPKEHPYSKKTLYMDIDYPFYYRADFYDRKGSLWRMWRQTYIPKVSGDGKPGMTFVDTQSVDVQRNRATYIDVTGSVVNNPAFTPDIFSPKMLQQAGSGGLDKFLK